LASTPADLNLERMARSTNLPLFVLLYTKMFLFGVIYGALFLARMHQRNPREDATPGILLVAFLGVCLMFAVVGALSCNWRPRTLETGILAGGALFLIALSRVVGPHWPVVVPAAVALCGYLIYLCWRLEELGPRLLIAVTLTVSILGAAYGVWSRYGAPDAHLIELNPLIWPRPWPYPDQAIELVHRTLIDLELLAPRTVRAAIRERQLIADVLICTSLGLVFLSIGLLRIRALGRPLQFNLREMMGLTVLVACLLGRLPPGLAAMATIYFVLAFLVAKSWALVRNRYADIVGGTASGALVAFSCAAFLVPMQVPVLPSAMAGALVGAVTALLAPYPWWRWSRAAMSASAGWLRVVVVRLHERLTPADSAPPSLH
jgi:hypothetical protein